MDESWSICVRGQRTIGVLLKLAKGESRPRQLTIKCRCNNGIPHHCLLTEYNGDLHSSCPTHYWYVRAWSALLCCSTKHLQHTPSPSLGLVQHNATASFRTSYSKNCSSCWQTAARACGHTRSPHQSTPATAGHRKSQIWKRVVEMRFKSVVISLRCQIGPQNATVPSCWW